MLLTSNPFARLSPVPPDGRDLNPLLQDPAMVAHPPMLYMGYVGFSVAFAFAIAALLSGRLDAAWARWSRPWTTVAWMFLTCGIALGSWWAYYELGWGGWWFWDPVENASFMPWLVGTALIHSLAVTEKRGGFKSWTVLLAIAAFSLSLLGTFLVRSGVLTSVHAFATDPKRGIFILAFLVFVIGGSLLLYAWRAKQVGLGGKFDVVSRESLLLSNNVLLVVAAGSHPGCRYEPRFAPAARVGKGRAHCQSQRPRGSHRQFAYIGSRDAGRRPLARSVQPVRQRHHDADQALECTTLARTILPGRCGDESHIDRLHARD